MDSSTLDDIELISDDVFPISTEEGFTETLKKITEDFKFNYVGFISGIFLIFACCISSALVCYTVFKLKALQTRTNYLLVNFFIVTGLFSLTYGVETCIQATTIWNYFLNHFLSLMQVMLVNAAWFITMLLALDWYSSAHWHGTFIKFTKYYKLIMGFFYLVCFVLFALVHIIYDVNTIISYFTIINYLTILITVIAWNIMRLRRTYTTEMMKTYYAFASATLYVLIWLPLAFILTLRFVVSMISDIYDWYRIYNTIIFWITSISIYIATISPVLIAFLLTRWDSQFKVGFGQVLKMKFARNNNLEGHAPYVNYTSGECIEEDVKLS